MHALQHLAVLAIGSRQWKCGQNCPLVHRGKNGEVCPKLRMVIANLLWNFHDKPDLRAHISRTFSAPGDASTEAYSVVARLTGLPPKTVFNIETEIQRQGWIWNLRPHCQPSCGESSRNTLCRPLATQEERRDHDFAAWLPPLGGDVPAIGGDVRAIGGDVHSVLAVGGDVHSGLPDLPKNDPAEEFLLDIDGDMPAIGGVGLLAKWRAHPNYHIGMRQAELATFWISAGLPDDRWPEFLTWFARTALGFLGNVIIVGIGCKNLVSP